MTCPHSDDLEPEWCSQCIAAAKPKGNALAMPVSEHAFPAKWVGECRGCNMPIYVGQMIRRHRELGYRHVSC